MDGLLSRVVGRVAPYHTIRMPTAHPVADRVLVWMCLLTFVYELGFGGVVPVLALYARSFGVSQTSVGLAISVYGLARFLIALPSGRLADGLGRRVTLAVGGLVTVLGNLLCAWAPTFAVFLAGRFVAGAGAALVLNGAQIVLADITTQARRGRTMAIFQGVFLFAAGIGPLPGGLLARSLGLSAPFLTYAVAGGLVTALAWLRVPETRHWRGPGGSIISISGDPRLPFRAQVGLLTRHPGFVLVGAIAFTNAVARTGALFALIPILGRDRLSLTPERIGLALALTSLVGLALVYPSGIVVDRYGRKTVIVPATLVAGAALSVFLLAPSYAWFVAGCLVWGVATGLSGAAPAAYAADVAPAGMNAAAMSAYRMLGDVGYVLGPLALGAVTDLFGVEAALAVAAALLVLVGLAFARFAPETYASMR
jgi:MFS transporter, DHA1 family, multidrug resistance protein